MHSLVVVPVTVHYSLDFVSDALTSLCDSDDRTTVHHLSYTGVHFAWLHTQFDLKVVGACSVSRVCAAVFTGLLIFLFFWFFFMENRCKVRLHFYHAGDNAHGGYGIEKWFYISF